MKRILALALVLVLVLGMTVTASAEGTGKLIVSSAEAERGDEITITISVADNPGVAGIEFDVIYDTNVLEWTWVEAGKFGGIFDPYMDEDYPDENPTLPVKLTWFHVPATQNPSNSTKNGTFATLTFKVKDDAPAGEYPIDLKFEPKQIYDIDGVNVPFISVPGSVTVKGAEPTVEDGFYLIGVNGWTVDDIAETDKFEVNPENTAEYMLKTSLAVDNEIKVVEVKDGKIVGWYPDGTDNNYKVDEPHSGDVTVYFKPSYDNAWSAFGGYMYIPAKEEPKTQIELYGASATLGGEIGLNFFLAPTEEQIADTGFKVTLTLGDTTKELALSSAKTRTQGDKTLYQFTFPLRAKQMNQQVEIKAFDGSGQAVALFRPTENKASESFKFSVVDYVKKSLDNTSLDDTAKNLVKAMSDYGSLVQAAIPYMANVRADLYDESAIKAVSAADLADYKAVVTEGEAAGVSYEGSTLVLDSITDLRIYLKATEGALADYTYEINGKAATLDAKGYVEISNVAAKNLGVFKTLVVKNGEGKTVLTVKLCVLSYVESAIQNSDDQNLINAMKALFLYNKAAVAYFNK